MLRCVAGYRLTDRTLLGYRTLCRVAHTDGYYARKTSLCARKGNNVAASDDEDEITTEVDQSINQSINYSLTPSLSGRPKLGSGRTRRTKN